MFQKKLENLLEIQITNICKVQAYDLIMCGYFCIEFIDFMLKGKHLLEHKNLFSPNVYKKDDKIILKYFQCNLKKSKKYCNVWNKYRKSWKTKIYILKKNIKGLYCLQ